MGNEDIELLRQFGEEVKKTQKKEKNHRSIKNISIDFSVFINGGKFFFNKSKKLFYFLGFYLKKIISLLFQLRVKYRLLNEKYNLKRLNTDKKQIIQDNCNVITEYQKQIGNISVIIRRRKPVQLRAYEGVFRLSSSSPVAYYFHRIDENETGGISFFSPRKSIWDFHYPQKRNKWSWIKKFFHSFFS